MAKRSFIDVDFSQQPEFTFGDLGVRAFDARKFASYADEAPVYSQKDWPDMAGAMARAGGGCSQLVTRIYNQKQEGSCVSNACSQANEIVQAVQFGKDRVVHLSAISLYKRIGSSAQSGASVSDGLEEMADEGVLPLDDEANKARFKHTMPNTGFKTPYPDGWEETARQFRAHEWLVVNAVDELVSALFNQQPVVVGRSGHSIVYVEPQYVDGKLVVCYANSWSMDWGSPMAGFDGGFGFDSAKLIRASSNWAFALRSVVVPSFQVAK